MVHFGLQAKTLSVYMISMIKKQGNFFHVKEVDIKMHASIP
jgi:hypothetical protein